MNNLLVILLLVALSCAASPPVAVEALAPQCPVHQVAMVEVVAPPSSGALQPSEQFARIVREQFPFGSIDLASNSSESPCFGEQHPYQCGACRRAQNTFWAGWFMAAQSGARLEPIACTMAPQPMPNTRLQRTPLRGAAEAQQR